MHQPTIKLTMPRHGALPFAAGMLLVMFLLMFAPKLALANFVLPTPLKIADAPATETQGVSERTFEQLQLAYQQINDNDFAKASELLQQLASKVTTAYEQAVVLKTAAYVQLQLNDYPTAIQIYQALLTMQAMTKQDNLSFRHNLAQLHLQTQQYSAAIAQMQIWLQQSPTYTANDVIILAQAQQLAEQPTIAIQSYERAIKLANEQQSPIKSNWYQQLIALHYQLKHYPHAIRWLNTLIAVEPKLLYFQQLAAMYELNKQPTHALAAFEAAKKLNLFEHSKQYQQFAHALRAQQYPIKAAAALVEGVQHQSEPRADQLQTWQQIAHSYEQAKEWQQASDAYAQALELLAKDSSALIPTQKQPTQKQQIQKQSFQKQPAQLKQQLQLRQAAMLQQLGQWQTIVTLTNDLADQLAASELNKVKERADVDAENEASVESAASVEKVAKNRREPSPHSFNDLHYALMQQRGYALVQLQQYQPALALYQQLQALQPNNSEAQSWINYLQALI